MSESWERRREERRGQQKENSAQFISHSAVYAPSNAPGRNANVDKTGIWLHCDWFPSSVNPGLKGSQVLFLGEGTVRESLGGYGPWEDKPSIIWDFESAV